MTDPDLPFVHEAHDPPDADMDRARHRVQQSVSRRRRRRRVIAAAGALAGALLVAGVAGAVLRGSQPPQEVRAGTTVPDVCAATPPLVAVAGGDDMVSGLSTVSVLGPDGSSTAVTGDWVATEPEFSPDGQRLVVVRADGDYESGGPASTTLWTIGVDGSDPRPLTTGLVTDHAPSWSPDGATIAFQRYGVTTSSGLYSLFTVPSVGGEPTPLVPGTEEDGAATTPEWSPDGSRVAFVRRSYDESGLSPESGVWSVAVDGSDAEEIAAADGEARALDWHPDGTRLLVSTSSGDDETVWAVDVATGRSEVLIEDAAFAHWSRGGTQVVHYESRGSGWHLVERPITADGVGEGRDLGVTQGFLYPYLDIAAAPCHAGDGGGPGSGTSAPPPTDEASGPVVIESAAGPPGTSLGDGFTVAEGTTLIGDPIPVQSGTPTVDEGWTASSVVDGGDPMEILDAYLRQAEAAGLVRETGPGCALAQEVTVCSVFARTPEPTSPRSFTAQVVRGRRGDVLSDHVVLRFSTTDGGWQYGPMAAGGDGPSVPAAPTTWPPLPGPGEGMGTAGELGYDLPVQEGSRLAGPPHLDLEDATGGIVALLEVTADPRTVLDAYLDHLADVTADASDPEMREIGDAVVTTAFAGGAGGDAFALTLVEREGRPTWLAIFASHD